MNHYQLIVLGSLVAYTGLYISGRLISLAINTQTLREKKEGKLLIPLY